MWKTRLIAFLAAILVPVSAWGGSIDGLQLGGDGRNDQPSFRPYRRVHLNPVYHSTVIEAMVYECPYCKKLDAAMWHWKATLPASVHFEQMPAVVGNGWIPMAQSYFAAAAVDPAALHRFDHLAFSLVQGGGRSFQDPKTYAIAAQEAGINPVYYSAAMANPLVQKLVLADMRVMAKAHVLKTPTLIICGRYTIDPGDVQSNYGMFFRLADALVSRCIRENRVGVINGTQ